MHHAKNCGNKKSLSNAIKDTRLFTHNHLTEYVREGEGGAPEGGCGGVTHDCPNILDSIAVHISIHSYIQRSLKQVK